MDVVVEPHLDGVEVEMSKVSIEYEKLRSFLWKLCHIHANHLRNKPPLLLEDFAVAHTTSFVDPSSHEIFLLTPA